jgi:hypothetical protein
MKIRLIDPQGCATITAIIVLTACLLSWLAWWI